MNVSHSQIFLYALAALDWKVGNTYPRSCSDSDALKPAQLLVQEIAGNYIKLFTARLN